VVTVSGFNERHLREVLPTVPVIHVPNGVALAEATGSTAGGPVLCVARLVAKKGIDTLLDAVALLAGDRPELHVEIAGDGELRDELEARAVDLGIDGRVRFLGSVSSVEVQAAYARASMLVLPCRIDADGDRDGMPTVILEAMARALPVVSTDVIGISEMVVHGLTGMLVGPDDPEALARAIDRVWSNPALANELGANGRSSVAQHASPRRSAHELAAVFTIASTGSRS
jgi:glycosyltransferase involved in cell wall biosynthesis